MLINVSGRGRLWSVTQRRPIKVVVGSGIRRSSVRRVMSLTPTDSKVTVRLMNEEVLSHTIFLQIGEIYTNSFTYLVLLVGTEIMLLEQLEASLYLVEITKGTLNV